MIDSQVEEVFAEGKNSLLPKILGAAAALVITALVFSGYALLRKRHAQSAAALTTSGKRLEPQQPPKALVIVDEALLKGGNSILGGTVRNTSGEKLEGISVELELKRRKDGKPETQLLLLQPAQLEPQQEGRYSVQLRAQDYSSARLVALKAGPSLVSLPYTTAQGQKRPP